MRKFIKWIVRSSANPQEESLTIKGILMTHAGIILLGLSALHLNITETELYQMIADVSTMIGAVLTVVGLGRKIYLTLKPQK